jgi:hypothetical protein
MLRAHCRDPSEIGTTKPIRRVAMPPYVRTATLVLLLAGTAAPLHAAAPEHDGVWKVKTSAEAGKCGTNYDISVAVKNGKVSYAGMWPVKATGGVNAVGLIRMEIAGAGHKVKATGLVRGDTASGDWSSVKSDCAGSWVARKA